jgi:hypothetical protein
LYYTKETIPTKGFDLMIENCQPFLQAFEELESSSDNKNINKGSGRLLDINTTVSVVVGLSLIPTAWFKEK